MSTDEKDYWNYWRNSMRTSKISFEEKMSWWKGDLFADDIIDLAINKSYRDVMRTIRNFSSNPEHDIIIKRVKDNLHLMIDTLINKNIQCQDEFDVLHKEMCINLVDSFRSQKFTIGQAQKWINMVFKNLHLLDWKPVDRIYEYCHVPIDSYMLNITNYQISKPWSKLEDYQEYLEYQIWFRNTYSEDIPLDKEFYLWLEEAKKNRVQ